MKRIRKSGGFTLVELLVSITILGIIGIAFATMFSTAGNIFVQSVQDERDTQTATGVLNDLKEVADKDIELTPAILIGGPPSNQLQFSFTVDEATIDVAVNGAYYDAMTSDGEQVLRAFSPNPGKDDIK